MSLGSIGRNRLRIEGDSFTIKGNGGRDYGDSRQLLENIRTIGLLCSGVVLRSIARASPTHAGANRTSRSYCDDDFSLGVALPEIPEGLGNLM